MLREVQLKERGHPWPHIHVGEVRHLRVEAAHFPLEPRVDYHTTRIGDGGSHLATARDAQKLRDDTSAPLKAATDSVSGGIGAHDWR